MNRYPQSKMYRDEKNTQKLDGLNSYFGRPLTQFVQTLPYAFHSSFFYIFTLKF